MTRRARPLALIALAIAPLTMIPATAATAAAPIKVTRFHLDQPMAPGTVRIEIAPDATVSPGPEAQIYIDAVARAMTTAGFTPVADAAAPAEYHVVFTVSRDSVELPPAPPPVSIGVGGGGGTGGFGLGGSVAFGVGKRQPRAQVTTQIAVRILRGAAAELIWEGRATQMLVERGKLAQPGAIADKLARALFKGFPGKSGSTITTK